jgi:23S rRNA (pseudouridine1915-N3)-methyltransferase
MKIKLIVIGKTDESFLIEGIEKYTKRLKHYVPFEMIVLPDVKQGSKQIIEKQKEEEGKMILSKIDNDYLILLDENGKEFSSEDFAGFLQKKMNAGIQTLAFVVGGPFGFSEEMYSKAKEKVSLSKMPFSHQMIRLFFTEQLYRGFTIIKGEKYHHK